MCGAQIAGPKTWRELWQILRDFLDAPGLESVGGPPPRLSYHLRPTDTVRMGRMQDDCFEMTSARWWFVPDHFAGAVAEWKSTTFNARIETAHEKPTFAEAWRKGRCVIPAMGYYEWTGVRGAKQPWAIAPQMNAPVFYFAGLSATRSDGLNTCTILTRPALPQIAHLHPRSPVMLPAEEVGPWLRGDASTQEEIESLGTSFDGRMRFHTVRPLAQGADGPELIEPWEPPKDPEQASLF